MNEATKKKLAIEPNRITEPLHSQTVRAIRAQQGIFCPVCGTVGVYRENCPNKCKPILVNSRNSTPLSSPRNALDNSIDSPLGLGVLWGNLKSNEEDLSENKTTVSLINIKADLSPLRANALKELKNLKDSDGNLRGYQYFAESNEGYCRNYPELTLHQVMRRLMRLVQERLLKNSESLESPVDATLLHPPPDVTSAYSTFYPQNLPKEEKRVRDYIIENKLSKIRGYRNYENQSSLRPADQLDKLFRGPITDLDDIYKTNPNAGESMHSKNTWKSVLSHSDDLATANPRLDKQREKVEKMFEANSKWVLLQKNSMEQTNDRFEHLVFILKEEMVKEHAREARELEAAAVDRKKIRFEAFKERLESVDLILKCLKSYNMLSGSEEADYLIFCMEKWRLLSRKRDSIETVANNFIANPSHQLLKLDSNKVEETASSSATTPLMKMGRRKDVSNDRELLENLLLSAVQHTKANEEVKLAAQKREQLKMMIANRKEMAKTFTIQHHKHPREMDRENMATLKKRFRDANLTRNIRKGDENDFAYLAPALIPIPKAFESDGSNPMISHVAEQTVHKIKQSMTRTDIGYTPQNMVPLYARLTLIEKNGVTPGGDQNYEAMAKDRRYTHYIGRPLNRFEIEEKPRFATGNQKSKNEMKAKIKEHTVQLVISKDIPSLADLYKITPDDF